MDIFILDKLIVTFLTGIGAEQLFKISLFGLGITYALCNNSNNKEGKK